MKSNLEDLMETLAEVTRERDQLKAQLAEKEELRSDEHDSFIHQIRDLQQQLAQAQAACAELFSGIERMVERLHLIHANEEYISVWVISQNHRGPYEGPNYAEELSVLEGITARYPQLGKGWLSPDEAAKLRAELTRWQNAFAMFKGSPEELAQWAVKDANERISQAQVEKILAVPDQLNFPILQIWKSQTTWVVKLLTDDPPSSATGATLAEAIAKFSK